MIIKGIPDWIVYVGGGAVGLYIVYRIALAVGIFGYDVGDIIGSCPQCQANPQSPACKTCLTAAAKGLPNPFGGTLG